MALIDALMGFIVLLIMSFILYVLVLRKNYLRYVKLFNIMLSIIFLGIMVLYISKSNIIESRYDVPYFVTTAKNFINLQNPYVGKYFCAYGPALPILIIPLGFFNTGKPLVILMEIYLIVLLMLCYYILRLIGLSRSYAFFASLLIGINPMLNYWAIGLAQLDDLLCAIVIIVLLVISIKGQRQGIMRKSFITGLITGFATSIKIYLMTVGFPYIVKYFKVNKKYGVAYILSAAVCFAGLNISFYILYGNSFILHAYIGHARRISGVSLSSLFLSFGTPRLYADLIGILLFISLLTYLYIRGKLTDNLIISIRRVLATLFVSLPLLYPVYLIPLIPIAILSIAPQTRFYTFREKIIIYSMIVLLGIAGRLYQYYIVEGYTLSIHAILTLMTFVSLLLLVKI